MTHKFNHTKDDTIEAIGFNDIKEYMATMIAGLMAISSDQELKPEEEIALVFGFYQQLERNNSLFDSVSQEIEALYLIKPTHFYSTMNELYKENSASLIEQAEKALEEVNLS